MGGAVSDLAGGIGDAVGSVGNAVGGAAKTLSPLLALNGGVDLTGDILKTAAPYGGLIGGAFGGPAGAIAGGMIGNALGGSGQSNAIGGLLGTAAGSMLSGPKTASAPDYMALAKQQSAASRTNQTGPFGSVNYTENPNGTWTQNTSYDPQVEQAMRSQYGLSNSQNQALQGAFNSGMFNNMGNIDASKLAAAPVNAGMTAQNAIMSRLQPQIQQRNEALQQQLANQGIGEGSEAYKRAMTQQGQTANDLYTQAASQGINIDQNARQQGLNEQISMQNQPLNYFNALRGGSQVQAPQFGAINGSGANLLGAGQAGYQSNLNNANAQNAYSNNMMGGMMGIGGQILSNPSAMSGLGNIFNSGSGAFNTGGGGSNFDWSGLGSTDMYWM